MTCENEVANSAIVRSSILVLNSFKIKNYSRSSEHNCCYLLCSSLSSDTMLLFLCHLSCLVEEYSHSGDAQRFAVLEGSLR